MAIQFDPNVSKVGNQRSGFCLWRLKELLVATGQWAVIGSGDGSTYFAYVGVTAPLSVPLQGSGGAYDALKTGTGTGTLTPSNWSTGGWCVLRDVAGRELLFADSTGTPDNNWSGYGRLAYSRSAMFDGTGVSATAIPGAAADEQWVFGARATPTGTEMFQFTSSAGYLHLYAHDTTTVGVAGFGWANATTTGALGVYLAFTACIGADVNGEGDPCAFVSNALTRAWVASTTAFSAWDASCTIAGAANASWAAEPQGGGKAVVSARYVYAAPASAADTTINSADLGYMLDMRLLLTNSTARIHPDIADCTTSTWLFLNASIAMPWPDTATVPLSGTSVIRACTEYMPTLDIGNGVLPVNQELVAQSYYQRVWDITNTQWCYYTKADVDPTPTSGETSPTHSGSISSHNIVSVTEG